jgi:hypothetical protein
MYIVIDEQGMVVEYNTCVSQDISKAYRCETEGRAIWLRGIMNETYGHHGHEFSVIREEFVDSYRVALHKARLQKWANA